MKKRIKKCESCNQEIKSTTGCLTCAEETVMKAKVKDVMGEFKKGTLHSRYSESPVTSREQAIAIALNQGRKAIKKKR